MRQRFTLPVIVWLLAVAMCLLVLARTTFTADMSAFLPKHPTAAQALLVDQLKEGVLSRTLLLGIEGADAPTRAALSRALTQRLQQDARFVAVNNGGSETTAQDRQVLFAHRYLLSPTVTAERFTTRGLRDAIGNSIELLGSPAGMLLKRLLPHDPTGEMVELFGTLAGGSDSGESSAPNTQFGAWASRDGQRAILMAQTRAAGSDTDGQQAAIAAVRASFATLAAGTAPAADARLLISGAPVFSVDARATIQAEVHRLALISAAGIVILLLLAYRSLTALLFGLLPVVSGALAGIAAVSLGFGSVHGITIGFGTTLIGEAVDYTIYYFVQSGASDGTTQQRWIERFWPTIRLGVMTSVCGFAALLFSGFPGLAQLGLYSIAGLVSAAAVTRFVLPPLCPAGIGQRPLGNGTLGRLAGGALLGLGRLRGGRWLVAVLALGAAGVIVQQRDTLWSDSLSSLSPVSPATQTLDMKLRADLGAPDLRYLVVVRHATRDAALAAAERAGGVLDALVADGRLGGYTSAARFLPSQATQQQRRAALPERAELAQRLAEATHFLPLKADKLTPFLDDVAAARAAPLLDREQLSGSSLALAVDSLLMRRHANGKDGSDEWVALLPLRAATGRDIDPAQIQQALAAAGDTAVCLDLAGESTRLYQAYLHEAILLALAGLLAIAALLTVALRSPGRALRVLLPLVVTVLLVIAGLALAGEKLTLLHLVGVLLIVAVGSNYALFFDRPDDAAAATAADSTPLALSRSKAAPGAGEEPRHGGSVDPQTLSSLLLANVATLIGFGTLAIAKVPVLHAIGITVGPGALLALILAALLARRDGPRAA